MESLCFTVNFVVALLLARSDVTCAVFPSEVAIGGIFDEDDGGSYSASKLAFEMAIKDINADGSILSGVTLKGIANTTTSLNVKECVDSVCWQMNRNVVAVVGPSRSTAVKATNYICSGVGLPQISYAASDPALFNSHQQYPYLIRTSRSGDGFSIAIMEMMSYFKWNKAVMLTSSDDYGSTSLEQVRLFSYERKIKIIKTETFPALNNVSLIDFTGPLQSIRSLDIRVIIVSCPGKFAKRLFESASLFGMMSGGWVWIVNDAIATEANLYNATVGPAHVQGILGITPSLAQIRNRANFEAKWTTNGTLPISPYSYKVYDAVWTLAHALNDMKANGVSLTLPSVSCVQCQQNSITQWADGQVLLNEIKDVQFTGELHPIQFNNEGTVLHEAYDFVNLQETGFEKIGYWDNSSGLLMNKSDIIWPGGTSSKPLTASSSLLKNKTLRIVTMQEPPFTRKKKGNFSGNDLWEGYCMDMLKQIAKELEFNYIIHESYDGNWGGKNAETQEWNGMVKELVTGQSDLIVAAFTISSIRQEAIDFTIPYIDLGLTVIMKKKAREKGLLAFMDPFTNDVWFLLFCSTMYVGFVLSICSMLSPYGYYGQTVQADENILTDDEMDELEEEKNNMRLDEAAWFSMGSLLGQGTDHQPKSISGKVVAAVWWMTGTIFVATYTANLAAFLTVTKSAITIKSLEDLASQDVIKYGTVQSTQPSGFFETSNMPLYQKMWAAMKSDKSLVQTSAEGFKRVQDGDYAFIWDSVVLEYVINQEPCNTFILDDLFSPLGYGIGLPLNSPYRDVFSNEILKLRENGFLDKLKSEWFIQKGTCGNVKKTKSSVVTVTIPDVVGVLLLAAGGIVLGFFALVFEWLYFTRKLVKKSNSEYPTYKQALKARLKLVWRDMTERWISRRTFAKPGHSEGEL